MEIVIDIESDDTVARIKERVEEDTAIHPSQQKLFYGAKQLADNKKASEYGISDGAVLTLQNAK